MADSNDVVTSLELQQSDYNDADQEDPSSEKMPGSESTPLVGGDEVKVYKRRWLMLLILCLNTTMNACLFLSVSPINNIARKYYDVGFVGVEWLTNMCVFSYIFLALPATWAMARYDKNSIYNFSLYFIPITQVK